MATRADIANAAAHALENAATRPLPRALVGFDGFVDVIVRMVSTRKSMELHDFDAIKTIPDFAARCAAAAGRSANIEQVRQDVRFGGNGPLMAGAVAQLGMPTTFVGAIGVESHESAAGPIGVSSLGNAGALHPVFRAFAKRCEKTIPIGPPSWTLCMEFDDGKIMLNDTANVQGVTWERVVEVVGADALRDLFESSRLIGIVNWSLLGGVERIWDGIARDILPTLSRTPRTLFVDLSDPAKRTDADIDEAMQKLQELVEQGLDVILGLNLAEASRVGYSRQKTNPLAGNPSPQTIMDAARYIRDGAGVPIVVVHPRHGAAAATGWGEAAWFDGPFTRTPTLSTGAGDHFNAGFAFAQVLGLPLENCLASGCGVSGYYVRHGESPTLPQLTAFLRDLPEPEKPA